MEGKGKQMYNQDTIVAVCTGQGEAGVCKIRVSGKDALPIVERIYSKKQNTKQRPHTHGYITDVQSHTIHYGYIVDDNEVVDEVLVLVMKAPRTYTKEDIVEIDCHGGTVCAKRIMELLLKNGARLADPGEFTMRGFLNGRMDLSQAEAVADLIKAETEESAKIALEQLKGRLNEKIGKIRAGLIALLAQIEVVFDYPEHDEEEITIAHTKEQLEKSAQEISDLIVRFEKGRMIKEGVCAAIVGRPNAGKSSLMNVLSGHARSIVTDIPGTTRDTVAEDVNVNGVKVILTDTAGIRDTEDAVELLGIARTKEEIAKADMVIAVLDCTNVIVQGNISQEDSALLDIIGDKPGMVLLNKTDLVQNQVLSEIMDIVGRHIRQENKLMPVSLLSSTEHLPESTDQIFDRMAMLLQNEVLQNPGEREYVTSLRHKEALCQASESIKTALYACDKNMPLDCVCVDIWNAATHLGKITGENIGEDVIKEIFSKFCLGK